MKRKYIDTLTLDLFDGPAKPAKPLSDGKPDRPVKNATAAPSRSNTSKFTEARNRLKEERERKLTQSTPTPAPPVMSTPTPEPVIHEEAPQAPQKPVSDNFHDQPRINATAAPPRLNTGRFAPPQDVRIILAALIGSGCFIMSVINTFLFLSGSGKSFILSFASSSLTAAFSASAFAIGRTQGLRRFIFSALALIIIAFSVFSTIAVSYDQLKTADLRSQSSLDFVRETEELTEINAAEKLEIAAEINRLSDGLARLNEQAEYWKNKSWDRYDAVIKSAEDTRKRIDELQERSAALSREARRIAARNSATEKLRSDSVYSFFSSITGIDENIFRFIIFCIPAVFFDIASPLMLGVLFNFLRSVSK